MIQEVVRTITVIKCTNTTEVPIMRERAVSVTCTARGTDHTNRAMVEPAVAHRGYAGTDTGDRTQAVALLFGWRGAQLGKLRQRGKRAQINYFSDIS